MCLHWYCCIVVGANKQQQQKKQGFFLRVCGAGQACLQELGRDLLFPSTSERLVSKRKPLKANCSVCLGIKMGFLGALSQMTAFLFLCTNCHNCMPFSPSKENTTVTVGSCISPQRLVPLQFQTCTPRPETFKKIWVECSWIGLFVACVSLPACKDEPAGRKLV